MRGGGRRAMVLSLLCGGLGLAQTAAAHPMAPALLELEALGDGRFDVSFQSGARRATGTDPGPTLPTHCRPEGSARIDGDGTRVRLHQVVDCGSEGLVGHELGVRDLAEARISALVRVRLEDGRLLSAVLDGGRPRFVVPARPRPWAVAVDYARMGFGHIWAGLDHLLFVFGLFCLAVGPRALLGTLTAFTVGHSITLSLAALDWIRLPTRPVEVLIAVSVLVVALELAAHRTGRAPLRPRMTWGIAGSFGLLHGLGFAGALAEAGLPQGAVPAALFSFNVGIELGQIAFVALLLPAGHLLTWASARVSPGWRRAGEVGVVYAMGALAAYWCIDRTLVWLEDAVQSLGV